MGAAAWTYFGGVPGARGESGDGRVTESRLERWGRWLNKRRPRISIEQIGVDLFTSYIASGASFRSNSTVYSTLSTMRGFGDFLVRQKLWKVNPLRWMKGPKVSSICLAKLRGNLVVGGLEKCGIAKRFPSPYFGFLFQASV
jgi:hypothetical protein